jgi:hypothetical protein
MAYRVFDDSTGYPSWASYYAKKKEEEGSIGLITNERYSIFDELPSSYAGDSSKFTMTVAAYPGFYFILLPAGDHKVRCLHQCLVFGIPGYSPDVFGILGQEKNSEFKRIHITAAVKRFEVPRVTRSQKAAEKAEFLPTMEEFMECEVAEDFKKLRSKEEAVPADEFLKRAQSVFLHPNIFEFIGAKEMKAADLAIHVLFELSGCLAEGRAEENQEVAEEVHKLLLFLWAVEQSYVSEVELTDPPVSSYFDALSREVKGKLEAKRTQGQEKSPLGDGGPPDDDDDNRNNSGVDSDYATPRKRGRSRKSRGDEDGRKPKARRDPSRSPAKDNRSKSSPARSKSRSHSSPRQRPPRRSPSPSDSDSSSDPGRGGNNGRGRSLDSRERGRPRNYRDRRGHDSDEGDRDLQSLMMKNLAAMTASQLEKDSRDEKKRSMLANLAPEASIMFRLLSARDWYVEKPKINSFMKSLVVDKSSNRALNIMMMHTKKWSGQASEKGLLEFFATGYAARDIHEQPGGFTIFMFRPVTSAAPANKKARQQQVKAMFGSTELDDEAVKYYSQNDFFLAESIQDLEEQIYTCILCLELFTERRGVATAGYEYGLKLLQKDRRLFKNFIGSDPLFAVKFAYLLDKVFQNFIEKLGDYHEDEFPITKARRKLKHYQRDAIERGMSGYEESSIPNLYLPSSLRGEEREGGKTPSSSGVDSQKKTALSGGGGGDQTKTPAQVPGWWSKNPNPNPAWALPQGKEYVDFFDTKDPDKLKNSQGWPKLAHHKMTSKKKNLCLKYQSKGSCNTHCFMTHVDPTKLDSDTRKAIGDRFQAIYS